MSVSENKNKKGKKFAPIVDEVAPFGAKELNRAVEFFRKAGPWIPDALGVPEHIAREPEQKTRRPV